MARELNEKLSKEEITHQAKKLATPIDFNILIEDEVLEKVGNKYKILNFERLPDHVKAKVKSISSDGIVTFCKESKSLVNLIKKLSK